LVSLRVYVLAAISSPDNMELLVLITCQVMLTIGLFFVIKKYIWKI